MRRESNPTQQFASAESGPLSFLQLSVIFLAAFVMRMLHLLAMKRSYPLFNLFIGDAASYNDWGQKLAQGGSGVAGVFYQDPLYPYFLGTVYRLFGYSPLLVRWIQAVLGSLNCVLIADIARRCFGKRAAWIAGAFSAAYGVFIFYEAALLKEGVSVFLSSLALWGAVVSQQRTLKRHWFLSGAFLGFLILTRGNALLLAPLVLVWLLFFARLGIRPIGVLGGSFLAGLWLVLSPATAHNFRAGHEWVLTTSQAGSNFYIGNHRGADGAYVPLVADRQTPEYEAQDAKRLAEYARGRALGPTEVSRFWFQKAFQYIAENPADWLALLWAKTKLFFGGYEIPDVEDYYLAKRFSYIMRLPLFSYHLLTPLALVGMLCAARRWRPLFFLYGFALVNAVSVILFYVFARYRLPSVPSLMVFASAAIPMAMGWFQSRSWGRLLAVGSGVALLSWAWAPKRFPLMASSLANLGTAYRQLGQPEKAIATLDEAIRLSPNMPETHFVLANLYMGRKEYERAIPEYQRAVDLDPGQTEARYLMGVACFNRKDYKHARQAWEDVLRQQPTHPEALKGMQILEKARL